MGVGLLQFMTAEMRAGLYADGRMLQKEEKEPQITRGKPRDARERAGKHCRARQDSFKQDLSLREEGKGGKEGGRREGGPSRAQMLWGQLSPRKHASFLLP